MPVQKKWMQHDHDHDHDQKPTIISQKKLQVLGSKSLETASIMSSSNGRPFTDKTGIGRAVSIRIVYYLETKSVLKNLDT